MVYLAELARSVQPAQPGPTEELHGLVALAIRTCVGVSPDLLSPL